VAKVKTNSVKAYILVIVFSATGGFSLWYWGDRRTKRLLESALASEYLSRDRAIRDELNRSTTTRTMGLA
jgi:hypothetical protein